MVRSGGYIVAIAVAALLAGLPAAHAQQQQAQPQQPAQGPGSGVQVAVPLGSEADQKAAQERQRRLAAERERLAALPIPRTEEGRVELGGTLAARGVWLPGPGNLGITDPPYQPWARALAADRRREQLEPHTRCKASGGPRQFLTPYGVEFVDNPETQRMYIFDIGGPHTYRTIFMDGRRHPEHPLPESYGHSIGWWEGDTLVVDTVGFDEGFWIDRGNLPHTTSLHLVERFTRTVYNTLRYDITIDDPAAYTAPFSGTSNLRWEQGTELFEYICQQENYASELMVGQGTSVDRSSPIVP